MRKIHISIQKSSKGPTTPILKIYIFICDYACYDNSTVDNSTVDISTVDNSTVQLDNSTADNSTVKWNGQFDSELKFS